jgi:predicted DCC family thiol-disulfide oxidoreductase YuxK
MTYSDKDPVEVTLGVCENCNNYVPFVRLITKDEKRVYQCMTCKAKHTQHVNGKVVFNFLEDAYTLKRN